MTNHTTERSRFESPTFEEERSKPMRKGLFSVMCAAFVVALSAAPSWSQTIGGSTAILFAKEVFGGGANPILAVGAQTVTVTYDFQATGDGNLSAGRSATFTFTLSAGTFNDPPNLLAYSGGMTSMTIQPGVVGDGGSSVSYSVTSIARQMSNNSIFTFTVPRIVGAGSVLGSDTDPAEVSIEVAVAPAVAGQPGGFPAFPAMTTTDAARKHVIAMSRFAFPVADSSLFPAVGATSSAPVIDVTDRTETAGTSTTDVTGVPAGSRTKAIVLSVFQIGRNSMALKEDGATQFEAATGSSGNLVVTAEGAFKDGDILFFSTDVAYAAAEALTVSGRTATLSLPLERTTGVLDNAERTLYYLPAAEVAISQGTIAVSYRLDITVQDGDGNMYAARTVPVGSTRITFQGIRNMAYAYAIPDPDAGDVSNMRIRCQGDAECDVFVDCRDKDGARIGGEDFAEITIPGNGLMSFNSKTTLPTLLGVRSWTGRISCNVMSNSESDIAVQVLTRSGGVLVNNTYVSGLEPNPGGGPTDMTNPNPSN